MEPSIEIAIASKPQIVEYFLESDWPQTHGELPISHAHYALFPRTIDNFYSLISTRKPLNPGQVSSKSGKMKLAPVIDKISVMNCTRIEILEMLDGYERYLQSLETRKEIHWKSFKCAVELAVQPTGWRIEKRLTFWLRKSEEERRA